MDNLYIVMPAYNEEANIRSVVEEWYPHIVDKGADSRLVIADSGSTDRTHAILLKLQKKYPRLEILSETGKQHGPKLMALYKYAIRVGGGRIHISNRFRRTDKCCGIRGILETAEAV